MLGAWLMMAALISSPWGVAAQAATRGLDEKWHFTDQSPAYQVQWPPQQSGELWRVDIDYAGGGLAFEGYIADPQSDEPLAQENRRGDYVFYHENGKPHLKGQYDDEGLITGIETVYRRDGSREELRQYEPDGYYPVKRFYADGSVELESLESTAERQDPIKRYRRDGSLLMDYFTLQREGAPVRVRLSYDPQGRVTQRKEEANGEVMTEEYRADGSLKERNRRGQGESYRSITQAYDEQGKLKYRRQVMMPDFDYDGLQVHVDGDTRSEEHYKNGLQEGLYTVRRDGQLLRRGEYHDDKPVGDWFETDKNSGAVTFISYDDHGEFQHQFEIGADLVVRDDQGIPGLPEAFQEVTRTLPEVGTTWLYQFNDAEPVVLTLTEKDGDQARYQVGQGQATLEEDVHRYQPVDQENGPMLRFPLHPGDVWRYRTEDTVKVPASDGAHWQYRYRTQITSTVSAVETIRVGAGTFKALRISREIAWRKDQASGEGGGLDRIKNGGDGQVDGFTQELLWYAPEAGRVVLKAHMESGDPNLPGRPAEQLLDNAATWFTELVALAGPGDTAEAGEPRHARAPQAGWIGFPMQRNNTWEYLMQSHSPQ